METIEVIELSSRIDAAAEEEEFDRALRIILVNFNAFPDPAFLRERIANILAATDREEMATEIYQRVARHYMNDGHPARVIRLLNTLEELDVPTGELLDRFSSMYSVESERLEDSRGHAGLAVPEAPLDLDPDPELELEIEDDLGEAAAALALKSGTFVEEPADDLPPMPLLSELTADKFETVVRRLETEHFDDPGSLREPDDSSGDLVWTISTDITLGEDDPTYRLRPGALVGLHAYGGSPYQSPPPLFARKGSEILRLSSDSIAELSDSLDGFRLKLEEIALRASIEALLEGHSMFEVIPKNDRRGLLDRFEGLEVEQGARLVEQGAPSPGLFLILDGEFELVREDEDWEITVETLGPGDVFGEVGLVSDRSTQADVVAADGGHALHLPTAAFEDVVSRHPELAKWAVNLAQNRLEELESTLSAQDLAEIPE